VLLSLAHRCAGEREHALCKKYGITEASQSFREARNQYDWAGLFFSFQLDFNWTVRSDVLIHPAHISPNSFVPE
jgi:hypothetical protein